MIESNEYSADDAPWQERIRGGYSEAQLEAALRTANFETAKALWDAGDWATYSDAREALLTLLRTGRKDEVRIEHLQFIYFVSTHVRPRFDRELPARKMFESTLLGRSEFNEFC